MTVPVEGWTEGRFNAFITSTLRGGMRRFPNKWIALKGAYTGKRKGKSGREAAHYKCAACADEFTSTNVEVDHIRPVVDPVRGFSSWDEYVQRLFCPVDNLQVLCKPCHKLKSKEEKACRTLLTSQKTTFQSDNPPPKKKRKPRSTSSSKTSTTTRKVVSSARASGKPPAKKRAASSRTK